MSAASFWQTLATTVVQEAKKLEREGASPLTLVTMLSKCADQQLKLRVVEAKHQDNASTEQKLRELTRWEDDLLKEGPSNGEEPEPEALSPSAPAP